MSRFHFLDEATSCHLSGVAKLPCMCLFVKTQVIQRESCLQECAPQIMSDTHRRGSREGMCVCCGNILAEGHTGPTWYAEPKDTVGHCLHVQV